VAVRRGFAVGDFDPSFPLDDKFVALANLLPLNDYLAASGLYWHLLAAAWRDGRRASIRRVLPTAPDPLVASLREVGLLDSREMVTRRAFDHWVGAALARRASETARKAAQRASRSDSKSDSVGTDRHRPERLSRGTPAESQQVQVQVGSADSLTETESDVDVGTNRERANGAPPDFYAIASALEGLTGRAAALRNPHGALAERALDLASSFGLSATLGAFQRAAAVLDHPDAGQIVLTASNLLRPPASPRDVARREEARTTARESETARARTRALIDERAQWAAEPLDDPPLQRSPAIRYDGPQRVGDVNATPGPQVRTEAPS
jgi:hypothetical protein